MKHLSRTFRSVLSGGLLAALLCGGAALAQQRDEYGAPVGYESYRDEYRDDSDDIRQTVARVSDMDGSVSYSRGDDPDNWQSAHRNVPLTIGDRLYSGDRSRVELQMHGGQFVRLGSRTDLAVLNLTDDTKQFAIREGVAAFRIRRLGVDEVFEVDTPNAAITLERAGDYRVDVDEDGNTRVTVREGRADVASGGASIALRGGEAIRIDGIDDPSYDRVRIGARDGWDRWVSEREARIAGARSNQYVSDDIAGLDDLDQYGRWENVASYGRVWTPTVVSAGWTPYRMGQWIWQDPWGWTWVSSEPWGWAPYHYGRWAWYSSRWYWVPVGRPVRNVRYSPALVAFVGGGPGWSTTVVRGGGGYVGWFPLAPRDPLIPWWGRNRDHDRATHVTYVNRNYVTVVNRNTFVSGGIVTSNVVRDRGVLRDVSTAPVLRGTLPMLPTHEAIRGGTRRDAAPAARPAARVVERPVVARVAPPPAPPRFEKKLPAIEQNRGAPVAPDAAAEISVRDRGRARAITDVKPVADESGRVTLKRRGGEAPSSEPQPEPVPVAPSRGRALSTKDQPVASAPVEAPRESGRRRSESREVEPRESTRERSESREVEQAPESRESEARPERGRVSAEKEKKPALKKPEKNKKKAKDQKDEEKPKER